MTTDVLHPPGPWREVADVTPTPGYLSQLVRDIDDKHDEGHHRLRTDYRALECRLTAIEDAQTAAAIRLTKVEVKPMSVAEIQFPSRVVLGIVFACVSLAIGQWELNARLRDEMLSALTTRAQAQDAMVGRLTNQVQLLQINMSDMKEKLASYGGRK